MGLPKTKGPFNKKYSLLRPILGTPVLGNYQISLRSF